MQTRGPIETDIVLLGAGHAHVEVLRRFALQPETGVRLTLVAREPETPYSGMFPGVIRGDYTEDQGSIDLAPLAAAAGARLLLHEATAIDLNRRSVTITGRPDVSWDILSIDIGGQPAASVGTLAVKPISRFLERLEAMEHTLPAGAHIAVVGGGPAGVELVLALATRFAGHFRLTLVCADRFPLPTAPRCARVVAERALEKARIRVIAGARAVTQRDAWLLLDDGSTVEADAVLWATGIEAASFLAQCGLETDALGCVTVDRTLRSVSHERVFAAGDCASVVGAKRPKAGVWAVRAGAVLADNLRRMARGTPLRIWKPQRDALVILGLGGGRAVAWRNGLAVAGAAVWRWKDRIDRRWMRMYTTMRMPADPADPMRCGGCGAKVGAAVLAGALASLSESSLPQSAAEIGLVVGLEAPDDAAVLRPPPGMLLVQSVDHFRAFLDDPYLFGQIAAAHALSDLHAMGAVPWTALAVASVSYASGAKMRAELSAMLQGASEVLRADGCTLVGGHSAEAAEPALGFAVTGLAEPGRLLRKSGLRPGDILILTKPIGTGVVLAGHMRGLTRAGWLLAATASMRRSNAAASGSALAHGATACTDVTGFGLAGHLAEMLRSSGVAAVLWPEAIPLLPGALALAVQGVASTLAPDNRRAVPNLGVTPVEALLFDPQTSGGLLMGVPEAQAAACLCALLTDGHTAAAIGRVEAESDHTPLIRVQAQT